MYVVGILDALIDCGPEMVQALNDEINGTDFVRVTSGASPTGPIDINDIFPENGLFDILLIPVFDVVPVAPESEGGGTSFRSQASVHSHRPNPNYPADSAVDEILEHFDRVAKRFEKTIW